jgi:hypothetical protein
MEEKEITLKEFFISMKRIEGLLREVVYQQILSRTGSDEEAHKKFEESMESVNSSILADFEKINNNEQPQYEFNITMTGVDQATKQVD